MNEPRRPVRRGRTRQTSTPQADAPGEVNPYREDTDAGQTTGTATVPPPAPTPAPPPAPAAPPPPPPPSPPALAAPASPPLPSDAAESARPVQSETVSFGGDPDVDEGTPAD